LCGASYEAERDDEAELLLGHLEICSDESGA